MILVVNTLENKQVISFLDKYFLSCKMEYEIVHTADKDIRACIGCNYCWLKTPGVCTIKDDYEEILKKIIKADQLWIVADTHFGFLSYKGKNVVDRLMPIVTMNLHIKDGEMRHVTRYKKTPDFGVIYRGHGEKTYLEQWVKRVALNFAGNSLGAYSMDEMQEVEHAFGNH